MSIITSGNAYQASKGNDLPVTITLQSPHGEDVTGLTISGYAALTIGGAAITSPATAFMLTEDTSSPSTARRYRGVIDAAVIDDLFELDPVPASIAIRIVNAGNMLGWITIPMVEDRVFG